jgi:chromosome segregation ATPase
VSKAKKIIINIVCGILIFSAGFCTGRLIRLGKLQSDRDQLHEECRELTTRLGSLEAELDERIRDVERLESNIDEAGRIADDIAGDIRQLRELDSGEGSRISDAKIYISELRKRVQFYEEYIRRLEEEVSRLKSSLGQQ